jgi:hypothetical protein
MLLQIFIGPIVIWAIFSLFICPSVIVGVLLFGRLREADMAKIVVLEVVIVPAHVLALLPSVQ